MTNDEQKTAIEYIQRLSEKQLVDFFYKAIKERNRDKKYKDGYEKDRICIIKTSFGAFQGKEDEEHYSRFMALPTEDLSKLDWIKEEKVITESGGCPKCKALVVCVAKRAICPVCDSEVSCT